MGTFLKLCQVDGCNDPVVAKGFCQNHYRRNKLTGSPLSQREIDAKADREARSQLRAPTPGGPSIRALLKQRIAPEDIVDEILESLRGALKAEKDEWIPCRKCGAKTAVVLPNLDVRVKAAIAFMSELEGKVGTQPAPAPKPKPVAGNLEDLSDDELVALLNTMEGTDGETDGGAEEEASG